MGKILNERPAAAQQFAKNIKALIASRGWSQAVAADQIGVKTKWLQRACHAGIAEHIRSGKRSNDAQIKAVVRKFKLGRPAVLWEAGLSYRPPDKHDPSLWLEFEKRVNLLRQLLTDRPGCRQIRRIFTAIDENLRGVILDEVAAKMRKKGEPPPKMTEHLRQQIEDAVCQKNKECSLDPSLPDYINAVFSRNKTGDYRALAFLVIQHWEQAQPRDGIVEFVSDGTEVNMFEEVTIDDAEPVESFPVKGSVLESFVQPDRPDDFHPVKLDDHDAELLRFLESDEPEADEPDEDEPVPRRDRRGRDIQG